MTDNLHVKIMVVDDEIMLEDLVRHRFRSQIKAGKYDFVFAHNGLEALSKLIEYPEIGVILCDINMPEMDGLTLLSELKELRNPSFKTVMVSAYGDLENIRTAMNRGAFDFITKPINYEDLEITIDKTLDEIFKSRSAEAEHNKLVSIRRDFEVARDIQHAIQPKNIPSFINRKSFDIHGCIVTVKEIAGDFYDYFMIDENRLGFVVGDVSEKGVPAAIFMAVSRTLIKATAQKGLSSSGCINYVNSLLCHEGASVMFVTVFYGVLNIASGDLDYTNAGHSNPILKKANNGEAEYLEPTNGIKLGFDDSYTFSSRNYQMNEGDTILIYTNGVTNAVNTNDEIYGLDGLKKILNTSNTDTPQGLTDEILTDVNRFADGRALSDDIALLAIQWLGD